MNKLYSPLNNIATNTKKFLAGDNASGATNVCRLYGSENGKTKLLKKWFSPVDDRLYFVAEQANSTIVNTIADLEYSTDGVSWQDYSNDTITLRNVGDKVYFRTKVMKRGSSYIGMFDMFGKIAANGNIQYLIDPTGQSLVTFDYCYQNLFNTCLGLTKAPDLPATALGAHCYDSMFMSCENLIKAPELPATNLSDYCYYYMFSGCTNMVQVPQLPATNLSSYCYAYMFEMCLNITRPPELPATNLKEFCYKNMFAHCNKIKLSRTNYGGYSIPYRIPKEGTGVDAYNALYNVFYQTGGTFTGTPEINTTYYLAA